MTVKQVFSGDSKDLVKAYQDVQRENIKLREENRRTVEESKRGSREIVEGFGEQLKGIGQTVIGLYSLERAVDTVKEAYADYTKELKELGEEQKRQAADRARALGSAGNIPKTRAFERASQGGTFGTAAEFTQAFGAAGDVARNLSYERKVGIAHFAAEGSVLKDPAELARAAGAIAEMMPQKGNQEAVDLAYRLQQLTGRDLRHWRPEAA